MIQRVVGINYYPDPVCSPRISGAPWALVWWACRTYWPRCVCPSTEPSCRSHGLAKHQRGNLLRRPCRIVEATQGKRIAWALL